MSGKLTLNLEQLGVESFAASAAATDNGPVLGEDITCLQTDCGNVRCCA